MTCSEVFICFYLQTWVRSCLGFGFTKSKHLKPKLLLQLRGFKKSKLQFRLQLRDLEIFGFSFGFGTSQIQKFMIGFVVSNLEKLNIFHFQIMFACTFCLNFNK